MAVQHDPDCLKGVSLLPAAFRPLFSFRYFNSVQSECFSEAFCSNHNMVVSAPTGSGKTVLFELCILQLLSRCIGKDGQFQHSPGTLKTVYVAPTKALVQEKLREWKQKFGETLGLNCQELTGDAFDVNPMQETDIILTTPEKFDSMTRRHKDHGGSSFFADVALFEIDEVHLLHEPRGAALEAIVSRMRMLSRYPEMRGCPLSTIRFVAVSATIPNIEDIGEWLNVPRQALKRFGEEVRPVKLSTKVLGYAPAKNDFLFERKLQNFLFDILMQEEVEKGGVLVFCSTRKGAQEAAKTVARAAARLNMRNPFIKSQEHFERLQLAAKSSRDVHLQECIVTGVGYHNGGMDVMERNLVENLFLRGDLHVLCTTNTLAHGVNLPAHTVIIKSTQYFNKDKSCYTEYERSTLVQMCGRAGRPQFDESGEVIIMTRRDTVHLYENILSGSEVVESELLPAIAEHLNAEIVLMTVSDVSLAIEWLKSSFLYIRIRKNPQHYKIENAPREDQLENHLKEICVRNVNELANFQMIETDEYGYLLRALEPGKLMAKYYLNFITMKEITKAPIKCAVEDMLYILSKSQELSWIQLRRNEKKLLNDINANTTGKIKYHVLATNGKIKKRIQSREEKIFLLANDALSGEPSMLDFTMSQDVTAICTHGARIARCMSEYFKYVKRFKETATALRLAKCIHQRLWEDSPYQLKQLPGVGMVTAKAFLQSGINSFEKLANADPRHLETITGRKFPFGNRIKEALEKLPPKVDIKLAESSRSLIGKLEIVIALTRLSDSDTASTNSNIAHLVVGSEKTNRLHYYEKIRIEQFCSPYNIAVCIENIDKEKDLDVVAELISGSYVGIDAEKKLLFTPSTSFMKESKNQETVRLPSSPDETQKVHPRTMPDFELIPDDSVATEQSGGGWKNVSKSESLLTGDKIFEHINQKAKNLSNVSHITSVEPDLIMPDFYLISEDSKATEQDDYEVEPMTDRQLVGDRIFEHINEKAKCLSGVAQLASPKRWIPDEEGISQLVSPKSWRSSAAVDLIDASIRPTFQWISEDPMAITRSNLAGIVHLTSPKQQELKRKFNGDPSVDDSVSTRQGISQLASPKHCIPALSASKLPRISFNLDSKPRSQELFSSSDVPETTPICEKETVRSQDLHSSDFLGTYRTAAKRSPNPGNSTCAMEAIRPQDVPPHSTFSQDHITRSQDFLADGFPGMPTMEVTRSQKSENLSTCAMEATLSQEYGGFGNLLSSQASIFSFL